MVDIPATGDRRDMSDRIFERLHRLQHTTKALCSLVKLPFVLFFCILLCFFSASLQASDGVTKVLSVSVKYNDQATTPKAAVVAQKLLGNGGGLARLLTLDAAATGDDAKLYAQAVAGFQAGRWQDAIRILGELIQEYPETSYSEKAHFLAAKAQHRLLANQRSERVGQIARHYQKAINKYPKSLFAADAIISMAGCYMELGRYAEAFANYGLVDKASANQWAVAEAFYQKNRINAVTKKYEKAMEGFEQIRRMYPGTQFDRQASIELAKVLFELRLFQRSLEILMAKLATSPDEVLKNPDILVYLGHNYYEQDQPDIALNYYERALNYFPEQDSKDILWARVADIYREQGAEQKAYRVYDYITRKYPKGEGAVISWLRIAAFKEKREVTPISNKKDEDSDIVISESSSEIYSRLIQDHAENPMARIAKLRLGLSKEKKGDYEGSLTTFKEMLSTPSKLSLRTEINAAIQHVMLEQGRSYAKKGKHDECVKLLQLFLSKYPGTELRSEVLFELEKSLVALFDQHEQSGHVELIGGFYEQMNRSLPLKDMPAVLVRVGRAYQGMQVHKKAIAVFLEAQKAMAYENQPPELLLGLGVSAMEAKDFPQAETALKSFIQRYPSHNETPTTHFLLGQIFMVQRRYAEALRSFESAVAAQPASRFSIEVLVAIGEAHEGLGEHDKNKVFWERTVLRLSGVKGLQPADLFLAYQKLGECYVKLKELSKAATAFEKALSLGVNGADVYSLQFRLAQCYQALELSNKAEDILNRIISSGDQFWSQAARTRMDELKMNSSLRRM